MKRVSSQLVRREAVRQAVCGVRPQATRLKKLEEKICDLLKTITPDYDSEMTEADNSKGRISKIEGKMNDL